MANGSVPDYVTRAEFEELEERVDTLHVALRQANAGIRRIEVLLKSQATTLSEHSIALGDIGSAIMRIETRLSTHDKVIEEHDKAIDEVEDKAERASKPDETSQALIRLQLSRQEADLQADLEKQRIEAERERESIAARKEKRAAVLETVKTTTAYVFGGGGLVIVLAAALKSCGYDVPFPSP